MRRLFIFCCAVAICAANATTNAQEKAKPAVAVAAPTAKTSAKSTAKATQTVRQLSVTVGLTSGTELRGTLMDSSELAMRTSFGPASIPLSEVAGIKLATEGNAVTTVVMHNGDSITGATDLAKIMVETEWGKAEVNGSSLSSILFAQGLQWTSSTGLNGTRWKLVDSKPTPTPTQSGVRQATSRPSSSSPSNGRPISTIQPVSGTRVFNGR